MTDDKQIRDGLTAADRKAVIELIRAADEMLAPLGYHGTISARDDRVSAFTAALDKLRSQSPAD